MIVSDAESVLFVHVQKTGGLTVQAALKSALPDAREPEGLADGRHATLSSALDAHPEWREYFIFGFVRNPWARLYSWHAMIMRRKAAAESGNATMARRLSNMEFWSRVATEMTDFETFVNDGPEEFERLRTPQLHYLTAGERRADLMGRTESLADDLGRAFERLGLAAPPQEQRNAGPPTDYRPFYTPEMRDRVAELFADDIAEFGYRF
jgi:hypothetical protein